mgnify:CR=1 FL=1
MKLRFFLTAIVALLAFRAHAQQGLNVNALFQGKVNYQDRKSGV